MTKILMVCLGNICRSPVAEGILKNKLKENKIDAFVDSAGTSGWHDGEKPDERSIKNARLNGVDISNQKSRKVRITDFEEFDYIFAMDEQNYNNLLQICPNQYKYKISMILNQTYPGKNLSVPDPYYTNDGFQEVFDLLNNACDNLINQLLKN
jgi:protein-tyrosine phosphatase